VLVVLVAGPCSPSFGGGRGIPLLHVGDSLTWDAADELEARYARSGFDPLGVYYGGTDIRWAEQRLTEHLAEHDGGEHAREVVVVATGTNNHPGRLGLIRPEGRFGHDGPDGEVGVLGVDPPGLRPPSDGRRRGPAVKDAFTLEMNGSLRALAAGFPNVHVARWGRHAADIEDRRSARYRPLRREGWRQPTYHDAPPAEPASGGEDAKAEDGVQREQDEEHRLPAI